MKLLSFIAIAVFSCAGLSAQKNFTEGVIVYRVTIQPGADQPAVEGTYTITVKGKMLRKDLALNNGYRTTFIRNDISGTVYSLQTFNGKKYAVQLTASDLDESRKPFEGFRLTDTEGSRDWSGLTCRNARAVYESGAESEVCYTKEWQCAGLDIFDRFPGIRYLPLFVAYRSTGNDMMRYTIERIDTVPVENALFRLPQDYKIISNEAYRSLKKQ